MVLTIGRVAGLLAATLALTACGDDDAVRGNPGPASGQPLTAADGTDLEACADGNCEIEVSGPVDIKLTGQGGGLTELSITEVTADGLTFTTTTGDGGTGEGNLKENCILTFYAGGGGSSCANSPLPAPEQETGVLAMQLADTSEDTVILRLISGGPGEPTNPRFPQAPTVTVPNITPPQIPGLTG